MKLVVTGGAGFIGSAVVRQAVAAGHRVVNVDAQGQVWWFETPLPQRQGLAELLTNVAVLSPQPELHIRGDARADYEAVGFVVTAAQQAGIARIGFLTEPPK